MYRNKHIDSMYYVTNGLPLNFDNFARKCLRDKIGMKAQFIPFHYNVTPIKLQEYKYKNRMDYAP